MKGHAILPVKFLHILEIKLMVVEQQVDILDAMFVQGAMAGCITIESTKSDHTKTKLTSFFFVFSTNPEKLDNLVCNNHFKAFVVVIFI